MVTWRSVCVPREHGVWGLLAGAALVGLPLGEHLAGLPLLLTAAALVCARQAWLAQAGSRSHIALLGLGTVAIAGLILAAAYAAGQTWLIWLGLAGALGILGQLAQPGRPWWATAVVGAAFACLGGAVASAGGAPLPWAVVGSIALAAHFMASVPLVRAQIRPDARWPRLALQLHACCAFAAVAGWATDLLPSGIPLLFAIGLVRACLIVGKRTTMFASSTRITPAAIGRREMAWLPVVAAGVVLGLRGGAW